MEETRFCSHTNSNCCCIQTAANLHVSRISGAVIQPHRARTWPTVPQTSWGSREHNEGNCSRIAEKDAEFSLFFPFQTQNAPSFNLGLIGPQRPMTPSFNELGHLTLFTEVTKKSSYHHSFQAVPHRQLKALRRSKAGFVLLNRC